MDNDVIAFIYCIPVCQSHTECLKCIVLSIVIAQGGLGYNVLLTIDRTGFGRITCLDHTGNRQSEKSNPSFQIPSAYSSPRTIFSKSTFSNKIFIGWIIFLTKAHWSVTCLVIKVKLFPCISMQKISRWYRDSRGTIWLVKVPLPPCSLVSFLP